MNWSFQANSSQSAFCVRLIRVYLASERFKINRQSLSNNRNRSAQVSCVSRHPNFYFCCRYLIVSAADKNWFFGKKNRFGCCGVSSEMFADIRQHNIRINIVKRLFEIELLQRTWWRSALSMSNYWHFLPEVFHHKEKQNVTKLMMRCCV